MATSNNDRISSRRLLDTLKGLQASRHLGSEPEVVTETVEYPAVVSPAAGTYNDVTAFRQEMASKQVNENRLPIKIYTTPSNPYADPVFPLTINEPSGDYVEADKKVTWNDFDGYANAEIVDESTYTGYLVLNFAGMWVGYHIENGTPDNNQYQWEMSEKTVTTTTKTKYTIKQDYVPNADWSVNDPDADGYVQGRTHWVERTVGDIPVTSGQGMSAIPEMVKPEGFKTGTTTWKPDYEAVAFEETQSGMTLTGYLLAEDENGNQITDSSIIFGDVTFKNGVVVVNYSAFAPNVYLVICRYNNQETQAEYILGITEVVHKLDNKYIDFPKQPDLSVYVKNAKKSDYDSSDIFETAHCRTSQYDDLYLIEYFTSNAVQSADDFVNKNLFNVKTGSLADRLNYYMTVYGAEYVAASLWRAGATLTTDNGFKCFPSKNFGEWTTNRDDYPYTVTFSTSKLGDKTFLKPSRRVYTITVPKHGISADSITDCFGHLGFEITLSNSNGDAIFIDKEKARFGFKRWKNDSTICPFNTDIAVFDTDLEFPTAEGYSGATNLSTSAYEYIKKCSGANVYLPLLDDNNNVVRHGWCEVYFDINDSLHHGSFAIKCRSLESTTATKFDLNVQTYVFWRNLSEVRRVS